MVHSLVPLTLEWAVSLTSFGSPGLTNEEYLHIVPNFLNLYSPKGVGQKHQNINTNY